jgi:hypothetical protein
MGEAKRRKQLGLMPEVENLTVILTRDGQLEGPALPEAVLEEVKALADAGERWDAHYRTSFIGAGLPRELLNTEAELMDIPVPDRMRVQLGLLSGSPAWLAHELKENPETFFEENGQRTRQLKIRAIEYDYNGRWAELPSSEPESQIGYLMQHPAVTAPVQGAPYTVTVWHGGERDGQIDITPEPDAEHHKDLAEVARDILRATSDAEWLDDHLETLESDPDASEEPDQTPPLARRTHLLLTPVPLVYAPFSPMLESSGEAEIYFDTKAEAGSYTLDSQTWIKYPETPQEPQELQALMAQLGMGDFSQLAGLLGSMTEDDDVETNSRDSRTIGAEVVKTKPAVTNTDNQPS